MDEVVNGFILPKNWYVKLTGLPDDKREVLLKWARLYDPNRIAEYINSQKFWGRGETHCTIITFDKFKKYVLKENDMTKETTGYNSVSKLAAHMKDRTITAEQAQSIIKIAKSSCDWKKRLAKLWGEEIALESQQIKITEELYKEMRGACNIEQHALFDSVFGKDKQYFTTKDLKNGEWCKTDNHHYFRSHYRIICLEDAVEFEINTAFIGKKVRIKNIEFEEVEN